MNNCIHVSFTVGIKGFPPTSFDHLTKAREMANGLASQNHNKLCEIHDVQGILKETYLYDKTGITHWKRLDL